MKFIFKCIRELVYAFGILVLSFIGGNILFRATMDLLGKSYTKSDVDVFMLLFGLAVLLIYILRKIFRRKKSLPPPTE
ncbi:MAG: hypothetical protein IPK32_18630 [Verrucomicrobiaceae bacterium]|nr:hypothetical protein [Verrucomicrobiaceae bacterium]